MGRPEARTCRHSEHKRKRDAEEEKDDELLQQYGGALARGWVGSLPAWCIPWVQLCRLSPPAALFLVYFPNVFGVLHAATSQMHPERVADLTAGVVWACIVLFMASFFGSNAARMSSFN